MRNVKVKFETLFADGSPEHRSVHQDTIVSASMQPASMFAAGNWTLDGEEGEEEMRTKKTMVKQVKSPKRPITPAFVSGFNSMKR